MEDVLLQHNYRRVVYLGDGRGDFCPCTRLGPNDCILARQSYPDGSFCALPKLLADHGAAIKESLQCHFSVGAEQKATPSKDHLQGLSAVGAAQKTPLKQNSGHCLLTVGAAEEVTPMEDREQLPLPVAADQQPTAAASRCRDHQGSLAGVSELNAVSTQGVAKRHKGQRMEQTWGGGSCSQPLQRHQPKCAQPDSAEIDSEKCQDEGEASPTAVSPENLPPPPLKLSGNMGQHELMQDCIGTYTGEANLGSVSHSQVQHAGQSSICAPVYTWTESVEAAIMLHALVNGEHEPYIHCQVS